MNHNSLSKICSTLIRSLSDQDFKGYDPYDLKAHPFFLGLIKWGKNNKATEIVREIILELTYHYPSKARSFFNISTEHNSKALGLIGTSIEELYLLKGVNNELLKSSQQRIDDLLNTYKSTFLGGIGWGYPFDWESQQLIPAHTPNGIVTTAVGEYYWTKFRIRIDKKSLATCVEICEFLSRLPKDYITDDKLCFSYIPHYQNYVHNLNLFVADFLIKVGIEVNNQEWISLGNKAVNYTLADQHSNGAFDYNGPPEKPQNFIDNYHTGFVLRMLGSCYYYTQRDDIKNALKKGITYYLDNFFLEDGTPKLKPDQTYRVDIHSAAEAVNCLIVLSSYHKKAWPQAEKVLSWTFTNLLDVENGDFYYGLLKSRFTGKVFKSEIKYLRWSQAWMLRALARYQLYKEEKKIIL